METLKQWTAALLEALKSLSPSCREATRLQSQSLDQPLSFSSRVGLRFHLLLCRWCRRYAKQVRLIGKASRENPDQLVDSNPEKLSSEARERMKRALKG